MLRYRSPTPPPLPPHPTQCLLDLSDPLLAGGLAAEANATEVLLEMSVAASPHAASSFSATVTVRWGSVPRQTVGLMMSPCPFNRNLH